VGNLREKDDKEYPGIDGRIILSESGMGALAGLSWVRIGTGGGPL
jgi:hypothetical protein